MAENLYAQALLNIIWSRQTATATELQRIADALATGNDMPVTPVEETVTLMNLSLVPLGFEIRKGISEVDASEFYAVCNQKADESAKMATHFKPSELLYFRSLIRVIMTSQPSGIAPLGHAISARTDEEQTKAISAKDCDLLIKRFIAEDWLSQPKEGYISIGHRCLLELRHFIEEEYKDNISECTVCQDLVFEGEACNNARCSAKLHHHCARKWFHGKVRKCMACTTAWPDAPAGWEDNEPLPAPRQFHPNALEVD